MLVGFLTPSDHKGVRKQTVDTRLCLWEAADGYNCLNSCNLGKVIYLVSRLSESEKRCLMCRPPWCSCFLHPLWWMCQTGDMEVAYASVVACFVLYRSGASSRAS